jgi:hypothetical protein
MQTSENPGAIIALLLQASTQKNLLRIYYFDGDRQYIQKYLDDFDDVLEGSCVIDSSAQAIVEAKTFCLANGLTAGYDHYCLWQWGDAIIVTHALPKGVFGDDVTPIGMERLTQTVC